MQRVVVLLLALALPLTTVGEGPRDAPAGPLEAHRGGIFFATNASGITPWRAEDRDLQRLSWTLATPNTLLGSVSSHASWRTVAVTAQEERLLFEIPSERRTQLSNAFIPAGCEGLDLPQSLGFGYCPACNPDGSNVLPYWRAGSWSACSKPCGGGVRSRTIRCFSAVDNTQIPDVECSMPCSIGLGEGSCNLQPCVEKDQTEFSCDPRNELYSPLRCSDLSRDGGRLTITVLALYNVDKIADCSGFPDPRRRCEPRYRDPPLAGLPDPYVKVIMDGGLAVSTTAFTGVRQAVWGDGLNTGYAAFMGVRASGAPIRFEVWDRNGGLTLADRLVASVSTNVIACSFASSLKFPEGCVERTFLPLWPNTSCLLNHNSTQQDRSLPCLRVMQVVEPHNVTVGPRASASASPGTGATPPPQPPQMTGMPRSPWPTPGPLQTTWAT